MAATGEDAAAGLAYLSGLGALRGGGAGLGVALPAGVRVAHHALQARASRTLGFKQYRVRQVVVHLGFVDVVLTTKRFAVCQNRVNTT